MKKRRARFWLEAGLAAITGILAIVTLISREWVEIVFRIDPDHGNGSFEWAMVGCLFVLTVLFGLTARTEWRRPLAT